MKNILIIITQSNCCINPEITIVKIWLQSERFIWGLFFGENKLHPFSPWNKNLVKTSLGANVRLKEMRGEACSEKPGLHRGAGLWSQFWPHRAWGHQADVLSWRELPGSGCPWRSHFTTGFYSNSFTRYGDTESGDTNLFQILINGEA